MNTVRPAPPAPSAARLAAQADAVSREIIDLVRHRRARLVGVRVAVPTGCPGEAFATQLAQRLAARGYAAVEVQVVVGPAFRVRSVELDR